MTVASNDDESIPAKRKTDEYFAQAGAKWVRKIIKKSLAKMIF